MENKNKIRLAIFMVYFGIFFVMPIFVVVLRFDLPNNLGSALCVFFLTFTALYIRHEWRKFPTEKYFIIFLPFVVNLLIVVFSHNWSSISENLLIGWAITFIGIMCADMIISLKKEILVMEIKKNNWKSINTPFLKKYWQKQFFKQLVQLGEPLFLLFLSLVVSFLIFLVIIYPSYISSYKYPFNLVVGIYVAVSIIFGTISYLRVLKKQTTS